MLKIGLCIIAAVYVLHYYIGGQDFYFVGHAVGLLFCAMGIDGNRFIKDLLTGVAVGRLFDELYFFVADNPEAGMTASLVLLISWPVIAYGWREYRQETKATITVSSVIAFIKWVLIKLF